jgi:hypothetical protein
MQKRTRLALIAGVCGVLALQGSAAPLSTPNYIASIIWERDDPGHGGFSGLEMADDGLAFTVISDRARWTQGTITRDAEGRIIAIRATKVTDLLDQTGAGLKGQRADSEGLAIGPDGQAFISFEGQGTARVMQFSGLAAAGRDLPKAPEFATLRLNAALEALAIDASGTLYTLPESPRGKGPFPVFRFRNGTWDHRLTLPRDSGFDPVGADFGPDGRFYVLERGFHGIFGFSSRVRSFALGSDGFGDMRLELQTAPATHDNLEGLAVWRDTQGFIRLTMVSDDNFFWGQRSEFVEYRVLP